MVLPFLSSSSLCSPLLLHYPLTQTFSKELKPTNHNYSSLCSGSLNPTIPNVRPFSTPQTPLRYNNMAPSSSVTNISRFHDSVTKNAFRSYLAEFISTFFFVFLVVGSAMSSRKLMPDAALNPTSLVVGAITNAFALSSVLYIAWDISGGHVNPAVTFAMAVGGHISVPTALFYWVAQLIASVMACLVLKVIVVGMHVPTYSIAEEMTGFGASVLEGALTFVLVYTVYAARDPRRGPLSSTGILVIGLIAGASALAAGPFSGGSMNPACAFGSAAIAGSFRNQAVYWVGPLIGATVAGLLYDNAMFPSHATDPIGGISEEFGV